MSNYAHVIAPLTDLVKKGQFSLEGVCRQKIMIFVFKVYTFVEWEI